jgi:DNA-binding NarL/FixJ family response regulator
MQKNLAPGKNIIRVLVADSSRIHTQLLADALKRDPELDVFPFDSNSRGLVAAVVGHDIDVLVISPSLDEQPARGFEVLREVRAAHPAIRAVVLLDSSKDEAVLNAFRAGARGVFSRNEPADVLSRCVRCIYAGQIWANSHELEVAVQALASAPAVRAVNANGLSLLSKRELQVVRSLAEGLTNREIAERLKLSQHTVKNYLFRVFDKLGVSSRVELLFMTLSRAGVETQMMPDWPIGLEPGNSGDEFALFQRAAESGLPAAQLALAQMYVARRTDPQDIVHAYMWYLIAMERASQAKGLITTMLTAKQIGEAQERAGAWLSRTKPTATLEGTSSRQPLTHHGD